MENKSVEIINQSHITFYFWLAGWMFTFGIGAFDTHYQAMFWYEECFHIISTFACWPFYLGFFFK
jgi:hypothetical protein